MASGVRQCIGHSSGLIGKLPLGLCHTSPNFHYLCFPITYPIAWILKANELIQMREKTFLPQLS